MQGNLKIAEDRILSYLLILGSASSVSVGSSGDYDEGPGAAAGQQVSRVWETHWVSATMLD